MDTSTRKQLNILIQLAEADKHFAKAERDVIFNIARSHNFPEEAVYDLIRNPEPIDLQGVLSPDTKFDYLYACIQLIMVDHKLFESELIFSKTIATKLGFKKNVVDYLVENFGKKPLEEQKGVVFRDFQ